jgi:hypothetical protein
MSIHMRYISVCVCVCVPFMKYVLSSKVIARFVVSYMILGSIRINKVTGYELDGRDSIPGRSTEFFLRRHVLTDSGAYPDSHQLRTRDSLSGGKAAGAFS